MMNRITLVGVLLLMMVLIAVGQAAEGWTVVPEARVREVLQGFVRQKTESLGIDARVRKVGYSGDLALPPGEAAYEVVAPQGWEGYGPVSLALIVRIDDRVVKNIPVQVDVEALADVVVAARQLNGGETLREGDVALQRREITTTGARFCRNIRDAVGKRVRMAVRANAPLRADYLEKPTLVKSGQMVNMVAENDLVRATARGRARSSGGEGDVVMVQNLVTQREMPALVVDANTVAVDF